MRSGRGEPSSEGARSWRLVRADRDAVPPSVRRFMARARQRKLRAVLPWMVTAGVLLVVGLLAWTMYGTAAFSVREVRVVGGATVTPDQVRAAVAVADRTPLAGLDLDEIRKRVEALPPVDRAVVSRDWPSSLVVQVVERTPVAVVPRGDTFELLDGDGVAYTTVTDRPAGLPLAKLANPGPSDVNTRSALTVVAALSDELREQLVAVSVTGPARITLQLKRDREIFWGDDTESEAKARAATALLSRKEKHIDVSAPDVVTVS